MFPDAVKFDSKSSGLLREGKYTSVMEAFLSNLPEDGTPWRDQLVKFAQKLSQDEKEEELISLGIAALSLFIQGQWTGPDVSNDIEATSTIQRLVSRFGQEDVRKHLILEDDAMVSVQHPQLLVFANAAFDLALDIGSNATLANLWRVRGYFIQQQILEDLSPKLYENIQSCMNKFSEEYAQSAECRLEKVRIFLYYKSLDKAQKEMEKAQQELKFSYILTGVLGKRTKFQQHNVAQLLCTTESSLPEQEITISDNAPFSDDVRLQHMEPEDSTVLAKEKQLNPKEYAFLLATLMIRKQSLPNHETHIEENLSIVERLNRSDGPWSLKRSLELFALQLLPKTSRNVANMMNQMEWILEEAMTKGIAAEHLKYFFISYLPLMNEIRLKQAELCCWFNDIKSAMEIYERLHKWELVIECLMKLNERHRAEMLIRQELEKDSSNISLLCYLGDVTDEPDHYSKALELSKDGKSARVRRHWGLHFFKKKMYRESIIHFQESLELNSFQTDIWRKLGWCAIDVKDFELGAKSFKRYCLLEGDDYEAWSNLAFCYSEIGENQKAIMILKEALKVDMVNWKTWDSLMLLHMKLGQYDETIRAYQQVLKHKPGHIDTWVLKGLVRANEVNENPSRKNAVISLLKELIDKTPQLPIEPALLYADLVSGTEKETSVLTELYSLASSINEWERKEDVRSLVLHLLEKLLHFAKEDDRTRRMFPLLANPAIATVLAYDPDNEMYLGFQKTVTEVLAS